MPTGPRARQLASWTGWALVIVGGLGLVTRPEMAPALVVASLLASIGPLVRGWRGARGTALRAAVVWAVLGWLLAVLGQLWAIGVPSATGRPGAGHWTYLSTLFLIAAMISVLNARRPGEGAWAILMGLLVLLFLIPWLEGAGLADRLGALRRLRLDAPWSLFFAFLTLAGVTNFLPTRYGPAAAALGLGFVLEYLGLTRGQWPPGRRGWIWSAVPWCFALSARLAADRAGARSAEDARCRLERLWLWFRDHWGVVWALRVQERFNRSAEASGWPIRLSWQGVIAASADDPTPTVPPELAETTLRNLLRRFADGERLRAAASGGAEGGSPCDSRVLDG